MIVGGLVKLGYLMGAIGFVWGLRLLSSPDTARKGNIIAGIGMCLAIVIALVEPIDGASNNYLWILGAMIVGTVFGLFASRTVQMTAMPQLVSIFNGLGGACAMVLATIEMLEPEARNFSVSQNLISLFTLSVGAISFSGSMLAYLKLDGKVKDKHVTLPKHQIFNVILLLGLIVVCIIYLIWNPGSLFVWIILILAIVYGFSFVAPIGGADMPVVISLLNSLTGLSAASAGVIYDSQIMLLGGILVGASGTILTLVMCQAMNRSLFNVILGNFGGSAVSGGAQGDQVYKEVTANDLAIQLFYSNQVAIVPGYGLAVAQAQKNCQELDQLLSNNGVEVFYAIHPVAGRMPGHMNVLLAEANVPYDKLLTLEEANEKFGDTDVVLIVGANDVVNPAAKDDAGSPIYGMPVLEVWDANHVVIMKRSMNPGYAGIQNPLFFKNNSSMLFGDAKASLQKIVNEVKNL